LALVAVSGCVTAKDTIGGGDARLDTTEGKDPEVAVKKGVFCGPEGKGDLELLDGRTGGPLTCTEVTVTAEPMSCAQGSECPSDLIFKGVTNKQGLALAKQGFSKARLVAVADGYGTSYVDDADSTADKVVEIELMPADGYWLKVVDGEGNYLPNVTITFKRGDDVLAQLSSNDLANVFFAQRQPFAGEPVTASAQGYQDVTINSLQDLGDDGHTLVLQK